MPLVDKSERISVLPDWNPSIEEILNSIKSSDCSFLDALLDLDEIKAYFKFHMVDNYSVYLKPKFKLSEQSEKDISYLLNQDSLWIDVRLNAVIRALRLQQTKDVEVAVKSLTTTVLEDVIYELEEALDDVFGDKSFTSIVTLSRVFDEKDRNSSRSRYVIIP